MWNRLAGLAALLVLLTGCTGGGPSPSPSPSNQDVLAVWRQAAQCAREHGLPDFPDSPTGDAQAQNLKRELEQVQQDCGYLLQRLPAEARRDAPPSDEDLRKLVEVARCMRSHGVPAWPGPTAAGRFVLAGTPLAGEGKSARILDALEACKDGTVVVTVDW
jgi:hypothetical protein